MSAPPALPPFPRPFQGTIRTGEAAARAASRVSGPFQAQPSAFVSPGDRADLERLVVWARDHRIPLVPRGAGTGMPGGNLGPSVVVDLQPCLTGVEVHRDLRTVRAGAGAVAADVDRALREHGRCLPFLPASAEWCTVGGMVANNAAGAASFRHGPTAEWVVGLSGFDARGGPFHLRIGEETPDPGFLPSAAAELRDRLTLPLDDEGMPASWPRVRKNSSGYALDRFLPSGDLLQLLVGSEGTLAVFTEVELRTAAVPDHSGLLLLPAGGPDDLVTLAREAADIGTTACEFLGHRFLRLAGLADSGTSPDGETVIPTRLSREIRSLAASAYALVLLSVEGSREEVREKLERCRDLGRRAGGVGIQADSREEAERLWSLRRAASPTIARRAKRGLVSTQFIEDSVVPVESLGRYLEGLDEILQEAGLDAVVFGHAGDGNVHVNPLVDVQSQDWPSRVRFTLEAVVTLVNELGGTLAGEHGDGRLRAPFLDRIWGPELSGAFRTVKNRLDPYGILNPGVIVPLPGQDPLSGLQPRRRTHP